METVRTLRPNQAFNELEGGGFVVEVGLAENGHGIGFLMGILCHT
jgi:hypothetical protein